MKYRVNNKSKRKRLIPVRIKIVILVVVLLGIVGALVARHIYDEDLKPVSSSQVTKLFTVNSGSSVTDIANSLKKDGLIRSSWAFELYNHGQKKSNELQAGTYALSPSLSTPAIAQTITKGKVDIKLVTILPGRRIDQVRADLINDGFSPASVQSALNPAQYSDLPVMAFLPTGTTTLEGLLWPDSFQRQPNTNPSVIIRESLTEMGEHLTPVVQAAFAQEGLTTYQGLILTSVILQEVSKPSDQTQVAQVFLSRLKINMPLGSDVTADYGSVEAGHSPSLSFDSPYNTLIHTGLPPTPISTVSSNALSAATHPASTNWLYFVAGDNGTTYFANTLQQQQSNTQTYCHKLCGN